MDFEYQSFANKVFFGKGQIENIPELLKPFPTIFIIGEGRYSYIIDNLEKQLTTNRFVRFSKIIQHVPVQLVDEAFQIVEKEKPDAYLAIGGGSAIGLAKALALKLEKPIIAVPTTYAGSEQTNIYGISSENGKRTGRDNRVLPQMVIYDTNLTATLPKSLAVTSGMNAMAHLMEALYAPNKNPITHQAAMQGMEVIKKGLEELAKSETLTPSANEHLQYGAYLAGKCLCEVSMSLHHKAAHVLGGSFGMEHAQIHTVLQAYVLDYQWGYLTKELQQAFKQALSSDHPPMMLKMLAANAGAAIDLESIGFKKENIEKAVTLMTANPYSNIAPLSKEGLTNMLKNAFYGRI